MEFVVNCDVFLYLLVCRLVVSTQAVIFSQSKTEGRDVILGCVNEGKVTWGKGTDGGRSDILTAEDGEITQKHRPDPENRYSVLTDLSLVIKSVALSDSGIYYCNSAPAVNLSVNPAPSETVSSSRPTTERRTDALLTTASSVLHTESTTTTTVIFSRSETEGRDVILVCVNEGKVTWGKGTDGGRSDILTAENGEITQKHKPDPENRYSVLPDLSLVIKSVALSDSGVYYCNSASAVNLTVNPAHLKGGVSVVESVLMFGGVGLAALMFLLATVAAGRVILHQNRQTGWTAGKEFVQLSPSDGEEDPSSQ